MFRKKAASRPTVDEISNIFGYVLQERAELINLGDLCAGSIYITSTIGSRLEEHTEEINDQFDIIAIALASRAYIKFGVDVNLIHQAFIGLMEDFLDGEIFESRTAMELFRKNFISALDQYIPTKDMDEMASFALKSMNVTNEVRWYDETNRDLAKALSKLERVFMSNIENEIRAK